MAVLYVGELPKKRGYYSHSMLDYGSDKERMELGLIEGRYGVGYEFFNPGSVGNLPMDQCYEIIDGCDLLIFSDRGGYIGKGVFSEVQHARGRGIGVIWLDGDVFRVDGDWVIDVHDIGDWRERFGVVFKQ